MSLAHEQLSLPSGWGKDDICWRDNRAKTRRTHVDAIEAEEAIEPPHEVSRVVGVEPQIPLTEVKVENDIIVSRTKSGKRQLFGSIKRHQPSRNLRLARRHRLVVEEWED